MGCGGSKKQDVADPSAVELDEPSVAQAVAENGPLAVQATKRLMYDEIGAGNPELAAELAGQVFASADAIEGATAFAEKRAPNWTGT